MARGQSENSKVAYLDIETNYVGKYKPGEERFFRDYQNHQITVLGVRLMDRESDTFIQLVDKHVSKGELIPILRGVHTLITYNGRSIPDRVKGRVGFDFPVIAAQLLTPA